MALRRRPGRVEESDAVGSVPQRTTRTAEPARELLTLTPRTGLMASAASTAFLIRVRSSDRVARLRRRRTSVWRFRFI